MAAKPKTPESRVEAVFLGNLPGYSGPWLMQYAHRLAKQSGPVAVLSVGDNEVDIDLVSTDENTLKRAQNNPYLPPGGSCD